MDDPRMTKKKQHHAVNTTCLRDKYMLEAPVSIFEPLVSAVGSGHEAVSA